jgi:glycosyltransferase involved in cell wall biosynthesis
MVTRDRTRLARRALRCLAAQDWPALELVVVDDGDADYAGVLAELPTRIRVRYVKERPQPGRFLGALRNLALEHAEGELCLQWDDDEWYHPARVRTQVEALGSGVAVVLDWTLMHLDLPGWTEVAYRADAAGGTPGTVLHRRSGARYPNWKKGEDTRFLALLAARGEIVRLGADASHLFIRCFHGDNTWQATHFFARLRRTPRAALSWAAAQLRGDLRTHRHFRLDERERAALACFLCESRELGVVGTRAERAA